MDKAVLIFLKRIIKANGREAIIINDNHYYDADDNEEITDLVEYAENLHDYGYKLFA